MASILVVDDMPFCRETIAELLRREGHVVELAADGREALAALKKHTPDLLLLDVAMPKLDGLSLLDSLRKTRRWRELPVVLLTDRAERGTVLRAGQLGVQGYLLKSSFDIEKLLALVGHALSPTAVARSDVPAAAGVGASRVERGRPLPSYAPPPAAPGAPPDRAETKGPEVAAGASFMPRDETIRRINEFVGTKTLAGVVAEVVAITSSPETPRSDLASVLKRDPVLSARVLRVANEAATNVNRRHVQTIEDAIAAVGFGAVHNIASSVGVFDTFPSASTGGLGLVRCWQHCFAVAAIMNHFAAQIGAPAQGIAHLVGLCHDLGEIVLRQVFTDEYARATRLALDGGTTVRKLEARLFNVPHDELVGIVLAKMGLPDTIAAPICEYARFTCGAGRCTSALACLLRVADYYAHGLLLAASTESAVAPIAANELRKACGGKDVSVQNAAPLREEAVGTTLLLAKLGPEETRRLAEPLIARLPVRVWYARHESMSEIDPLGAALQSLSDVQLEARLPESAAELDGRGLVIAVPAESDAAFQVESAQALAPPDRLLHLADGGQGQRTAAPVRSSISLDDLAKFLASLGAVA
ncbi:MAG: HDOD domain-containing protein [Phycisphaerae bacterium]|jgi:CheY-like chemotaxis protein